MTMGSSFIELAQAISPLLAVADRIAAIQLNANLRHQRDVNGRQLLGPSTDRANDGHWGTELAYL